MHISRCVLFTSVWLNEFFDRIISCSIFGVPSIKKIYKGMTTVYTGESPVRECLYPPL
jgi:hypothetical protein